MVSAAELTAADLAWVAEQRLSIRGGDEGSGRDEGSREAAKVAEPTVGPPMQRKLQHSGCCNPVHRT